MDWDSDMELDFYPHISLRYHESGSGRGAHAQSGIVSSTKWAKLKNWLWRQIRSISGAGAIYNSEMLGSEK